MFKHIILIVGVLFLVGCQSAAEQELEQIIQVHANLGVEFGDIPEDEAVLNELIDSLEALDVSEGISQQYLDTRVNGLKAVSFAIEAGTFGNRGTTQFGFGCGGFDTVMAAAVPRNASANAGFAAADAGLAFLDAYPDSSVDYRIARRDLLVLRAVSQELADQVQTDVGRMNRLCGDEEDDDN